MSVHSSRGEVLGKQKQKVPGEGLEMRINIDEKQQRLEKQETQGLTQDISEKRSGNSVEHYFLGSSVCYGGPDECYDCVKQRQHDINNMESKVKNLEEEADPSNLEYTTRGNWWKGNGCNSKAGISNRMDLM
ncbi:hypothetical protein SUGI_0371310 [Cryptomeria japonica]|nr:hypothetical protein SUGI_0371310 [Cryptomeria japonica]